MTSATPKKQKLNLQWLKDNNCSFFVNQVTLLSSTGEPQKDEQGNILYDNHLFCCALCKENIVCEKLNTC